MKNYPNTLLGYFKNAIARQGESTKYFNRDFLAIYLHEYAESKKNGYANYPKTKETKFYNDNSTAYCVFLEAHYEYEKGMERLRNSGMNSFLGDLCFNKSHSSRKRQD